MTLPLTVVIGDDVLSLELPADATLQHLRAAVAKQHSTGGNGAAAAAAAGTFLRDGAPLAGAPAASLSSLGVGSGDLLVCFPDPQGGRAAAAAAAAAPSVSASAAAGGGGIVPDAAAALAALRADPAAVAALPLPLQEAVRTGDLETLGGAMRLMAQARGGGASASAAPAGASSGPSSAAAAAAPGPPSSSAAAAAAERASAAAALEREIDLLNADPFDPEAQKKIAELLRRQAVEENLEHAIEHAPEAFAEVVMLYVNLTVNGVPMKAFVDSGAQRSIMSRSAAEKCNILRLMDTRFAGVARGVGAGVICGRVHAVPVVVGGGGEGGQKSHVSMSVTVMDQESMPFLFGLDMLRRFQCCIDLSGGGGGGGVLRFPTLGASLPFLSEHEIPQSERFEEEKKKEEGGEGAAAAADSGGAAANGGGAATTTTTTTEGAAAAPSAAPAAADPEKVARLAALGFDPEAASRALLSAGGNEELAASMLFGDA